MADTTPRIEHASLARQFAALWSAADDPPDVFAFLAAHATASPDEKLHVLLVDQNRRWRMGRPRPVEEYFERCPDMAAAKYKVELLHDEFFDRKAADTQPDPADFAAGFPDVERQLLATLNTPGTSELPGDGWVFTDETRIRENPALVSTVTHDMLAAPVAPARGPAKVDLPAAPPGYELLEPVGAGGMGVVYRAREIAFDRDVAVKFLREEIPADSPNARRFLDEARITAQLQHPAIPPVHHIGMLPDGRPFLAMKLIKGETLAELLAKKAPVADASGSPNLIQVFAQLCQGVAYAHARQVIHRDLKPANVMVGAFGEVQVMDWGLAKVLGNEPDDTEPAERDEARTEIRLLRDADSATQAGSVMGTPAFMAPEQAGGEVAKVDERSDVFGLGAVLCGILTGKPPFSGKDKNAVRLMAMRGETADAFARLDACEADPELVTLCKRCLATDCEARPRNAGEVAQEVTAHLAAAEERARQAELDHVRTEEQRKRRRVQLTLAAAVLGLVVVAGFGVAVASLWRQAEGAKETAVTAQHDAETARLAEEISRTAAEKARDAERTARGAAEKARDGEKRAKDTLAVFEYGRTLEVAHQEWRDNNVAAARALLDGTRPELRGWEWHYVHRLCHADLVTFKGHTSQVSSASFSPDGSRVVTGSWDAAAKVWDTKTGAELLTLKGHTGPVDSASFSPDGSRIVTGSYDKTAKVWDAKTGAEVLTLKGHSNGVISASFSHNGSRIVTASEDRTAKVWDVKTGAEIRTFKGHTAKVAAASFSPDGSWIVTGSGDKTAKVWDAKTGAEVLTLKGHTFDVYSASFSPDGSRIVTASYDRTAKVWDAKTGVEVLTLKGHTDSVRSASFSPDGSRIVTASEDRTAKVWDVKSGAELLTLKGHTNWIGSASFSPDGSKIVTGGFDKTAKVWDAKTGASVLTLKGHTGFLLYGSFSPDGSRIVTAGRDLTAKVWDAKTGAAVPTLKGDTGFVFSRSFSPDGSRNVSGRKDNTVTVKDAKTGSVVLTLTGHSKGVLSASFSPDGSRIVTASSDGSAKVWDAKTGADILTLEGHTDTVWSASFSPDGSRIVTASDDNTAKVWDAKTGAEVLTLKGHSYLVTFASFSPDGSRIVTGSGDGTAKVWDARPLNREFLAKNPFPPRKLKR